MIDVPALMRTPGAAETFASRFLEAYLSPAFGALSKTEVDNLVFRCLIQTGAIDPAAPVYDIARALNLTPTRVRTLIFNWQLRSTATDDDLRLALVAAIGRTRFAKDNDYLTFGIESPLVREDMIARLKRKGVYADTSFSRDIVRIQVDVFVEFLDDLVDDATKRAVVESLVDDKQLPDRSFKALLTGVVSKLGEKVAGEAGSQIAGAIVEHAGKIVVQPVASVFGELLSRLFGGDAAGAAKLMTPKG
jgi:hypothetical protein